MGVHMGVLPPFAARLPEALLFLDETGSPNYLKPAKLAEYHRTGTAPFPIIFGLAGVLISRDEYFHRFDPAFRALKVRHFGADIPMHEYDLRKKDGAFNVLRDRARWNAFHDDLAALCAAHHFTVVVVAIHKPHMQDQYQPPAFPFHPYHYSLENIMERTAMQSRNFGPTWRVIAEDREQGLNDDLQREMLRIQWNGCGRGIGAPRSNVTADEVQRKFDPQIVFRKKTDNDSGLQIADLAVGPMIRHMFGLDTTERQTFRDIIIPKLCCGARTGTIRGFGLKCFPQFPAACPI